MLARSDLYACRYGMGVLYRWLIMKSIHFATENSENCNLESHSQAGTKQPPVNNVKGVVIKKSEGQPIRN